MKYTVVWTDAATNRLADIYTGAADRRAVQAASDQIDLELKADADRQGHALAGNRRWLHIPPLLVVFTADPGDCMARVLKVGYVR
jgi:plasmid stabilization system protein ParE